MTRMFVFYYVMPYTDPFGRYKEIDSTCILGQFVCVCVKLEVMTFRSIEHTRNFLWCLGTGWFLFGKCDLRWVLFKLQDSRS